MFILKVKLETFEEDPLETDEMQGREYQRAIDLQELQDQGPMS
jgi:hypothetical protein